MFWFLVTNKLQKGFIYCPPKLVVKVTKPVAFDKEMA